MHEHNPNPNVLTCPACGLAWPAANLVCRRCLVELVDDPAATVRCRHCRRLSPAYKQSCPSCLAELHPRPEAVFDCVAQALAEGRHLPRPDGTSAFAGDSTCTLLRLVPRGGLVVTGAPGWIEAHVVGQDHRAELPLRCLNLDGSLLFRLDRYAAADNAAVAFDVDGAPLGTFLQGPGLFDRAIDVRDEACAPVARLCQVPDARGRFELVETGGRSVLECEVRDVERDGCIDDEWSLRDSGDRVPLPRLAVVALVLAAKVLLGRVAPVEVDRVA